MKGMRFHGYRKDIKLLIGAWKAATWAVNFHKKHGFKIMPDKDGPLRKYRDVPERQIETSCILVKRVRKR